jgi:hypothetical protein
MRLEKLRRDVVDLGRTGFAHQALRNAAAAEDARPSLLPSPCDQRSAFERGIEDCFWRTDSRRGPSRARPEAFASLPAAQPRLNRRKNADTKVHRKRCRHDRRPPRACSRRCGRPPRTPASTPWTPPPQRRAARPRAEKGGGRPGDRPLARRAHDQGLSPDLIRGSTPSAPPRTAACDRGGAGPARRRSRRPRPDRPVAAGPPPRRRLRLRRRQPAPVPRRPGRGAGHARRPDPKAPIAVRPRRLRTTKPHRTHVPPPQGLAAHRRPL